MTIGELFHGILGVNGELAAREVLGVTSDTREVENGFVFVCIKGESFDGHKAAADMISKGAAAVVTEHKLGIPEEITVSETRKMYPELLSIFYGRPTEKLKIGAATGTNGKTTIVNLCVGITRWLGKQTGIIGTTGIDTGRGLVYAHDGPPTTPEPRKMYELFKEMADIGTEYCFLEASSQALAQYRFAKENFCAGAFTNLTPDHLDYHKTMKNYFYAKLMLFPMCGVSVINIDDEYGKKAAVYCKEHGINIVTTSVYGEGDYYTEFVRLKPDGADFILTDRAKGKSYPVKFGMTGYYNVSNAIQAAVMCGFMGVSLGDALEALGKIKGVKGRLETLYNGKFTVIRDYAHTADGLRKLLSAMKPITKGKLICVFGAAGERDPSKRPDMGAAASEYSDYLIITTDSPRFEDPEKTVKDVRAGVPDGIPCEEYIDREQAIARALELAEDGDLVALCGKGHEDYQAIRGVNLHFDEKEIVERLIGEMGL